MQSLKKNLSELQREQLKVQLHKDRSRTLKDYENLYLFNQFALDENGCHGDYGRALTTLLDLKTISRSVPQTWTKSKTTRHFSYAPQGAMAALVSHLHKVHAVPLHWCDIGAGYNFAQKDFLLTHARANKLWAVSCSRVDLFDWDPKDLLPEVDSLPLEKKTEWSGRINRPSLPILQGDATTVVLPRCHLITAIEVLQYIADKLAALCNWYNALVPGGFLIVALESNWGYLLSTDHGRPYTIMNELLATFDCYVDSSSHCPDDAARGVSTLIIRKKANHAIAPTVLPKEIYVNPYAYKITTYPTAKAYLKTV
jgi:hypothetical protein